MVIQEKSSRFRGGKWTMSVRLTYPKRVGLLCWHDLWLETCGYLFRKLQKGFFDKSSTWPKKSVLDMDWIYLVWQWIHTHTHHCLMRITLLHPNCHKASDPDAKGNWLQMMNPPFPVAILLSQRRNAGTRHLTPTSISPSGLQGAKAFLGPEGKYKRVTKVTQGK